MAKHLIAALLVAGSAVVTGPAFASGYGRAAHYDPTADAPASQRGLNNQTIVIDRGGAGRRGRPFGGVSDTTLQSGAQLAALDHLSTYSHH